MTDKLLTKALYYNQWTGWENNTINSFFRRATTEDIEKMKAGDQVWIDIDPIHPNGKVYGYLAFKFKKFADGYLYHNAGYTSMLSKIYILTDEPALRKFIKENPLADDIEGDTGRMATSVMEAFSGVKEYR